MKALIIEDEQTAVRRLTGLLEKLRPDIEVMGLLPSVKEAVAWFGANSDPDIVFSDIRLNDGLSFSIYDRVNTEAMIVFTTAFDEYAVKAFDYDCADYLLKPIGEKALERALERCEKRLPRQIREIGRDIAEGNVKYRKRLFLISNQDLMIADVEEICYIFTERGYTLVHLRDGSSGMIETSLADVFSSLDPAVFYRANRQTIVNMGCVRKVAHGTGRNNLLILRQPYEKEAIKVTHKKAQEILKLLDN